MEILECIKSRRTIRRFKPDPVPESVLDAMFEAAMWAPSPANEQPWEFFVVGPQARAKILALFKVKGRSSCLIPNALSPNARPLSR